VLSNLKFVIIGGSDAGISAALRAHELDPEAVITVALADGYPDIRSSQNWSSERFCRREF
jgi:thioredoxin reductase